MRFMISQVLLVNLVEVIVVQSIYFKSLHPMMVIKLPILIRGDIIMTKERITLF